MQQVVDHCDRAIYLDAGKVVADGKPEDVVELYFSANHIEHGQLEHASQT
jgi:ABC-type polysaccharide/polyol phosphate transport system ATPase subunit